MGLLHIRLAVPGIGALENRKEACVHVGVLSATAEAEAGVWVQVGGWHTCIGMCPSHLCPSDTALSSWQQSQPSSFSQGILYVTWLKAQCFVLWLWFRWWW